MLQFCAVATIDAFAKDYFSALEQQQISIETKGLFDKSSTFQINFADMAKDDYSFPLPVGKTVAFNSREVEIETKKGDAVKAMFGGHVRLSRHVNAYGNTVVIRHDNGLETVYCHMAQNLVQVGDRVKAGQTVGIVGAKDGKGFLLFSIMVNGNRINPSTILNVHTHSVHKQIVTIKKLAGRIDVKTSRKAREKQNEEMRLDTNDPFQGKVTYRLHLDEIKKSEWHYPLEGSKVISGYGGKRNHAGVDIKNGPGTNVFAAFDGLVVQSGVFSGYGKCITIRHANGLETRYSHNSKNFVTVGEKVKAGQIIGIVGRTGRATTEHVHFETRIAGRTFDPSYVFDHANHCLQKGTLQFKKNGGVVRIK